jgi:hypothetical protein
VKLRGAFVAASAALLLACAAPAGASEASVSISPGELTLSEPSISIVGERPVQLDVKTSVIDARGTGSGWFMSMSAYSPSGSGSSPSNLLVTSAAAACLRDSTCTLPVNDVPYPIAVGSTGLRSRVFEAQTGSGLGAQALDLRVVVPKGAPTDLRLSFSISTQP